MSPARLCIAVARELFTTDPAPPVLMIGAPVNLSLLSRMSTSKANALFYNSIMAFAYTAVYKFFALAYTIRASPDIYR